MTGCGGIGSIKRLLVLSSGCHAMLPSGRAKLIVHIMAPYLKDSNAVAHSIDKAIFYAGIHSLRLTLTFIS